MQDWVALNSQETELFMLTIETSIRINKRFQFFLWAQGTLQRFLPHETLICARGDIAHQRCRHELFSRAVLDDATRELLSGPVFGLGPVLLRMWRDAGTGPLRLGDDAPLEVKQGMARLGVSSILCCGIPERGADTGSFFAFLGSEEYSPRQTYMVELLMPYLHTALARICDAEDADNPQPLPIESLLSSREREVLEWMREGKTNHEIGHILSISPLTVKNHVQNILRKLKVCNRAQAVATGLRAGLFQPLPVSGEGPAAGESWNLAAD